jgi:hypothetical protein
VKVSSRSMCVCGHAAAAHEHYRRGSDCAFCGPGSCGHFRSGDGLVGWVRRWAASLTGNGHFTAVELRLVPN